VVHDGGAGWLRAVAVTGLERKGTKHVAPTQFDRNAQESGSLAVKLSNWRWVS
jgi:hypothetical protein